VDNTGTATTERADVLKSSNLAIGGRTSGLCPIVDHSRLGVSCTSHRLRELRQLGQNVSSCRVIRPVGESQRWLRLSDASRPIHRAVNTRRCHKPNIL